MVSHDGEAQGAENQEPCVSGIPIAKCLLKCGLCDDGRVGSLCSVRLREEIIILVEHHAVDPSEQAVVGRHPTIYINIY